MGEQMDHERRGPDDGAATREPETRPADDPPSADARTNDARADDRTNDAHADDRTNDTREGDLSPAGASRSADAGHSHASMPAARGGQPSGQMASLLAAVPLLALVLIWRGGGIAGWMFAVLLPVGIAIALLPWLLSRRAAGREREGTVRDVTRRELAVGVNLGRLDAATRARTVLYTMRIADDDGRIHAHEWMGSTGEDDSARYHEGDRVRYARGGGAPEVVQGG